MALSIRGTAAALPGDGTLMWKILDDTWCPRDKPSGYVNLGVAENSLMHQTLSEHVHRLMNLSNHAFTYGDGSTGSKRLKNAMASFLNLNFHPTMPITPSHITVTNGCSSALEHLSWTIADPGDGFLLGKPFYGTFIPDLSLRTGATVIPVTFGLTDPLSLDAVGAYKQKLTAAQKGGQRIRGIVLCNPHNPLGRCYPREVLLGLMCLCQEYDIHFICDEIYALSVWENTVDAQPTAIPFQSCLSVDTESLVDRSRIHVIWGMSKDFGANGLRLGAIVTQENPMLHAAIIPVALYSSVSSMSDHVSANILEDNDWMQAYTNENRRRLGERYSYITAWAQKNGIPYMPGVNAAFFLWVNLGSAYRSRRSLEATDSVDVQVMTALLSKKVFLASGKQFGSESPGWFRIVFACSFESLEEGLHRILQALGE
jgi:aspartate/methionine/tyrosine aminotransferase